MENITTYLDHFIELLCNRATAPNKSSATVTFNSLNDQAIFLLTSYSLILVLSVLGNLLVLVTLLLHRRMRTPTNILLLNLSISDLLLIVVCAPFTLTGSLLRDFIFGRFACHVIPYLQAVSVSVSAWTLVAISHERYSGICRPLRSRGWRTASHARKRIAVVWISSLVFMAPIAITSTLMPVGNTGRHKCREQWPSNFLEKLYWISLMIFLLLLPLLLMLLAYLAIRDVLNESIANDRKNSARYTKSCNCTTSSSRKIMSRSSRFTSSLRNDSTTLVMETSLSQIDERDHNSPDGCPSSANIDSSVKWNKISSHVDLRTVEEESRALQTKDCCYRQSPSTTNTNKEFRVLQEEGYRTSIKHRTLGPEHNNIRAVSSNCRSECVSAYSSGKETGPLVEGSHGKETDALIGCEERKCAGNDERRSGQTKKLLTSKQHSEEFQANSSRTILVPGIGIDEFDFESSRSSTDASGADGTGKPKFSSIVIHKNRGPGKFKLNKSKAPSVEICLSETVNDAVTFSQRFNPTSKRNKNVRITQKRTRENQIINHETSLRSTSSHKALRDKQRMIKMIGVVVLEFFICWTPLYVLNTVSLYNGSLVYRILGMKGVAGVHLLAYCSACCNPITYCFMSRSFRSAFYSVVQCRKLGVRKSLDVMS
ncbi:cholecystokinin receptor type A-like [Hyalella azteca]|uniref:Gastrin/cholecystokinin type B receptor n=1 Tax=Hyalella azteca TaxID=294128 RepID=A0A979FKW1_HYAAZ|nr:cholecystokinin receptor type A-like [Hyalella azteca]